MQKEILKEIEEGKIVAIIRGLLMGECMNTIESLIESGINNLEITLNTDNALEIIKNAVLKYENVINIGAGTVKNKEDAKKAIEVGAKFLISPNTSKDTIKYANQKNVLIIPGALTPTEIVEAKELGCEMVKLFPVSFVNDTYIKEIKAPLDDIKIMAVGGVNIENASKYLNLVDAIGVGSGLIKKEFIKNKDYKALKDHFLKFKEICLENKNIFKK